MTSSLGLVSELPTAAALSTQQTFMLRVGNDSFPPIGDPTGAAEPVVHSQHQNATTAASATAEA